MKQKNKQILKIAFIFVLFCFISCVNDDFVENNPISIEKKSDYTVKKLSNNDFKSNAILKNRLEKFSRKKDNLQHRNIYYSDYGFSIDTDDFLFIGNDNIHTYTFNVEKDVEDEYEENLVLKHTGNNNYVAFLIRYDLTAQDKEAIASGQSISNYLSKAEFAYIPEINGSILGTQNRTITYTSIECNDVVIGSDYTETYDENGVGHWELITYYQVVCEEVTHVVQIIDDGSGAGGGGGGNPIDGGTGSTGGGGTGGGGTSNPDNGSTGGNTGNPPSDGNTGNPQEADPSLTDADGNPILTTSVLPNTKPRNHINELNTITNRAEVKQRLIALKADVTTLTMEQGSEYFTDDDNPNEPLIKEDLTPKFSGIRFGEVYENSTLRVHSHHYPALEPVFSAEDILGMGFFYKEKRNMDVFDADNITSILVSNLGTFALRITDKEKAKQFSDKFAIKAFRDAFREAYKKKVRLKAYNDCNCLLPNVEFDKLLSDYLIDFLNDENTGLTLYSGTIDADGNFT